MADSYISRNILGGVNQQPDTQKSYSQCREAKNMYFSPVDGAGKRAPTEHVAQISATPLTDRYIFVMDRSDEQYIVVVGDGEINIYDKNGNTIPTLDSTNSTGNYAKQQPFLTYLGDQVATGSGRGDFAHQIIADTAFLVNKNVVVQETQGWTRPSWDVERQIGGVFVRQFGWGVDTTVTYKAKGNPAVECSYGVGDNNLLTVFPYEGAGGPVTHSYLRCVFDTRVYGASGNVEYYDSASNQWYDYLEHFRVPFCDYGGQVFADEAAQKHYGRNPGAALAQFSSGVGDLGGGVETGNNPDAGDPFEYDPITNTLTFIHQEYKTTPGAGGDKQLPASAIDTGLFLGRIPQPGLSALNVPYYDAPAASFASMINTHYVADRIKRKLDESGTVQYVEPVIKTPISSFLVRANSLDIEKFTASDSASNTYVTAWSDSVEEVTDLPLIFKHGAFCRINGASGLAADAYYVRFACESWARITDRDFDTFYDEVEREEFVLEGPTGTGKTVTLEMDYYGDTEYLTVSKSTDNGANFTDLVFNTEWSVSGSDDQVLQILVSCDAGDIIRVDRETDFANKFEQGQWVEATKREEGKGQLVASTMPVIIKRSTKTADIAAKAGGAEGDVYFDCRIWTDNGLDTGKNQWARRTVGDADTNPTPSFVGNTINDIFFWQGRLGFLSQASVIMSETGRPENFWRTTQLSVPSADRIDISATEDQGRTLRYAVPLDERLLLFSPDSQVLLSNTGTTLSVESLIAPIVSKFEGLEKSPPTFIGRSVYFPYANSEYAGIRELVPLPDSVSIGDVNLTTAIPRYIPIGDDHRIVGSSTDDILFMSSKADPSSLYVFKFLKDSREQYMFTAWSKWTLPGDVIDFKLLNRDLYMLVNYATGTTLERIRIGPGITDPGVDFKFYLDRRFRFFDDDNGGWGSGVVSATWNGTNTLLTFDASKYKLDSAVETIVVTGPNGSDQGGDTLETVVDYNANTIVIVGENYTNRELYIGSKFIMEWQSAVIYPAQVSGSREGTVSSFNRRTIVQSVNLDIHRTQSVDTLIQQKAGSIYRKSFTAGPLEGVGGGEFDDFITGGPLQSGQLSVPIHAVNGEFLFTIYTDSVLPSNIASLSWQITQRPKHRIRGVS